jgi:DNA invertase Pin-like site-specific DNA recombinase
MKYVIYLRVSTKEQDLRTQEQKCLKFIKSNDETDFQYIIFTDSITSKKPLEQREGLNKALNALNKGDILVGQRVDRLARNELEAHKIKDYLIRNNNQILMIDQPGVTDPLIFSIYAALAAKEVVILRERIKDKLWAKKERNERTGGIPYGFSIDEKELIEVNGPHHKKILKPGRLIINPLEQKMIEEMNELFEIGLSYRRIAEVLTEKGYRTREGKEFLSMTIYRILRRKGKVREKDQPLEESKSQWSRIA